MPGVIAITFVSLRWGLTVVAILIALLVVVGALCTSRAIVLDGSGFRLVPLVRWLPSLVPRRTVPWSSVERFVVWNMWGGGRVPSRSVVRYYRRSGERAWWSISAVYALRAHGAALSAEQLCDLLNERLAEAR